MFTTLVRLHFQVAYHVGQAEFAHHARFSQSHACLSVGVLFWSTYRNMIETRGQSRVHLYLVTVYAMYVIYPATCYALLGYAVSYHIHWGVVRYMPLLTRHHVAMATGGIVVSIHWKILFSMENHPFSWVEQEKWNHQCDIPHFWYKSIAFLSWLVHQWHVLGRHQPNQRSFFEFC